MHFEGCRSLRARPKVRGAVVGSRAQPKVRDAVVVSCSRARPTVRGAAVVSGSHARVNVFEECVARKRSGLCARARVKLISARPWVGLISARLGWLDLRAWVGLISARPWG